MSLFARIFCKLVELILHGRTFLIHGIKVYQDPTWLLVHYQSDAQKTATSRLGKELGVHERATTHATLMKMIESNRLRRKQAGERIRLAVIVPFRDGWTMTQNCINSLLQQNLESIELTVCLVDNGSSRKETLEGIELLKAEWHQRAGNSLNTAALIVLHDNRPFNFSELNNRAVKHLMDLPPSESPQYLLFLNNDTLFEAPDSLERLLFFASCSPQMGAVGCTLLYRNSAVQHLFLAPGVKLAGAHPAKGIKLNEKNTWYVEPRPVPAVTGALLLIATENFNAAKGFDTTLATSCQDLDLCLKLQELGLENWVLPNVFVKHFETSTRLKKNQVDEITYVSTKWGARLAMNGYYSSNLTRWSERPALSWEEGAYPWGAVLNLR